MRTVIRLRLMRLRSWVLPLILAALAARAFMPSGFMMAENVPGSATVIQSTLCSRDQERRDAIELPGSRHTPRCDHCLNPLGDAPIALLIAPARIEFSPLRVIDEVPQVAHAPLLRSQSARAPPHA
jgi:hypothetical protein